MCDVKFDSHTPIAKVMSLGLPLGKAVEFVDMAQQQQQQQQQQQKNEVVSWNKSKQSEGGRFTTVLAQRNV